MAWEEEQAAYTCAQCRYIYRLDASCRGLTGVAGEEEQNGATDASQQGRSEPGDDDDRHTLQECETGEKGS